MIRLHLLGFTHDLKGLVFSGRRGGRTGTYWLPVDDTLLQALSQLEQAREEAAGGRTKRRSASREQEPERLEVEHAMEQEEEDEEALLEGAADGVSFEGSEPVSEEGVEPARVESRLSPREVQQLLREGRSVKEVAAEAGVEPWWVERFIGPVLEERAGVVRMLQGSVQSRPRLGPSGLPIGAAVVRNLRDRKATPQTLEEAEQGWDARRIRPRMWRVRLRYKHRGKRYVAEWELRRDTREVTPRNKLAAELGWWPPPVPAGSRAAEARPGGRGSTTKAAKRGPKPKAKRKPKAKPKPKAKTKPKAKAKPKSKPKPKPKPKPRPKTKAKPKPRAKAPKRASKKATGRRTGRGKTSTGRKPSTRSRRLR